MLSDFAAHCGGWLPAARLLADIADQFDGTGEAWADTMVANYRRDSFICLMQAALEQRLAGVA